MQLSIRLMTAGLCGLALVTSGVYAGSTKAPEAAGADWAKRATEPPGANAPAKEAAPSAAGDEPSDKKGWTQRVISPVFSQLVMLSQPVDFVVRFENAKGGSYIREAVPKNELVEDWSQMITVTGLKSASETGSLTPQRFFDNIAAGFERACPETFVSAALRPLAVDGHRTYAAVASCGNVQAGVPRSETAAILVIQGAKDFYTLQWAARGAPSSAPLAIDAELWQERLAKFLPVTLCDIKAGEKAPYASCMSR